MRNHLAATLMTTRHLILPALLSFVCIGCNAGAATANLTVTWAIKNVDGSAVGCNHDFTGMVVHVQSYSDVLGANEEDIGKVFDCSAGQGTLSLPLSGDMDNPDSPGFPSTDVNGKYDVWVSQTDATGTVVRQSAFPTYYVDLTTGDKSVTSTLYEDGGYYGLYWGMHGLQTDQTLDCAPSGVDTVRLTITGGGAPMVTTYPCLHDEGRNIHEVGKIQGEQRLVTIGPLVQGTYSAKLEALTNGAVVGMTDPDNGNYPAAVSFTIQTKTYLDLPYEIYTMLLTSR